MSTRPLFEPVPLHAGNPGPMTGRGNWTYLIAAPGGQAALIDAGVGVAGHLEAVAAALARHRSTLSQLIATHAHSDHVRGAPALAAAHEGLTCRKYPWPSEDGRFAVPWVPLADHDRLAAGGHELRVVHTPGHAPDHCAFWHPESGTLFAGDLIIPNSSVAIQTKRGGSMRQYLDSLTRILALEPRVLLPAHGAPIPSPAAAIRIAMAHRMQRERQVAAALTRGLSAVPSIAESIYHGLSPTLMPMAHENVRAHLEKLRDDRRAGEQDGRWFSLE